MSKTNLGNRCVCIVYVFHLCNKEAKYWMEIIKKISNILFTILTKQMIGTLHKNMFLNIDSDKNGENMKYFTLLHDYEEKNYHYRILLSLFKQKLKFFTSNICKLYLK
ncbi:unnamed protein product, partial [Meganyctiphanes norvegica]